MDGVEIRGNIISVKVAKYKRGRPSIDVHDELRCPRKSDQDGSRNSTLMEGSRSFRDVVIDFNLVRETNKGKLEAKWKNRRESNKVEASCDQARMGVDELYIGGEGGGRDLQIRKFREAKTGN